MKEEKGTAYQLIKFVWENEKTNSYSRINRLMYEAVLLAISGNFTFNDDDFSDISKNMSGGYWFGANSNGKGMGEGFYSQAISYNNTSAIKSYEKYIGLKPFITNQSHYNR